jgi:hypothetical protein
MEKATIIVHQVMNGRKQKEKWEGKVREERV